MIERTTLCPLPGFETVAVTYNLMINYRDLTAVQVDMGQTPALRERLIKAISGWPGGPNGDDPFGTEAPLVVMYWLLYGGFYQAVREYATSPKS